MPNQKVISLELNELNFEFIRKYIAMGHLPNFAELISRHQLYETVAEQEFSLLEPWIQWPTVYTGKTFAEHGVFHLGDISGAEVPQIWDELERRGFSVAAVSPMNAANRCENPVFFLPDPWTVTTVSGGRELSELYAILRVLVNENAHSGGDTGTWAKFLVKFVQNMSLGSSTQYAQYVAMSRKYKWAKALVLDRFLADVFIKAWKATKPDFSSLFLNAGAHIQHHHIYECAAYEGEKSNPTWYSRAGADGVDPVLHAYQAHDKILADILALDDVRLMVTTGLSQVPNPDIKYQYRFKDHEAALAKGGVPGATVVPRMSRDFLVECRDAEHARLVEAEMNAFACGNGQLFSVENRGETLFCQICYFGHPDGLQSITKRGETLDLSQEIVLVSIENGIHQTIGYHVDTGGEAPSDFRPTQIPLTSLYQKTLAALDPVAVDEAARAPAYGSPVASAM